MTLPPSFLEANHVKGFLEVESDSFPMVLNDNNTNTKTSIDLKSDFNGEQLMNFFESYVPESDLSMLEIHRSVSLKMKRYKDCVYYGELLNGKRHGKGVMVYHNGRVYEGLWESDFKHGKGYERFSSNSKY